MSYLGLFDGINPPYGWIEVEGLFEGTEYPCLRTEINSGTCAPVGFKLTEVDYTSWMDYCQSSD